LVLGVPPEPWPLALAVTLVGLLALAPLAALALVASQGEALPGLQLDSQGLVPLANTLALVLGVGCAGGLIGTCNGWLTARCQFPGRRWLRLAQLLPLATPSYLLAGTLIDLGSRSGLRIGGLGWAIAILTLGTYSYVVLLSSEAFARSGARQQEVCRSLAVGPWGSFLRVALPLALPAVAAGVALGAMEVINEFGAVQLLGVPTLSAAILERWQGEGDLPGAVGLALVTLLLVALLLWSERQGRSRSRLWAAGQEGASPELWPLRGWRCWLAQLVTLAPPLASLAIPLIWISSSWDQLPSQPAGDLVALGLRSLGLALGATGLTLGAALVLSIGKRLVKGNLVRVVADGAALGYAIPGTVLALGFLLLGGGWGLAPVLLLVWGYVDRFLAVAKGGLDTALEGLAPSVDEAAQSLGCDWVALVRRIQLPLLRGPLLVAGVLVFVDTVKELPLTFALRPFDFDTLAVRVYQYASDERLGAALVPALVILVLGLLAALALMPSLDEQIPDPQALPKLPMPTESPAP
jgi:iron(III) transport system permease protein